MSLTSASKDVDLTEKHLESHLTLSLSLVSQKSFAQLSAMEAAPTLLTYTSILLLVKV